MTHWVGPVGVGGGVLLFVLVFVSGCSTLSVRQSVLNRDAEGVESHVSGGADVDHPIDWRGETPLFDAVRIGDVKTIAVLLAGGAEVNHTSRSRSTPITVAAEIGSPDILRLLAEAGADVNYAFPWINEGHEYLRPNTPLMIAAKSGHVYGVMALLEAGADPASRAGGMSVLEWALDFGPYDMPRESVEIGILLVRAGASAEQGLELVRRNWHLESELAQVLSEAGARNPYELIRNGSPEEFQVYLARYEPITVAPDLPASTRIGDAIVRIIGIPVALVVLLGLALLESPPLP